MVNVTHFHQLALFICHLFINGNFRTVHIVYQPNAFEFNEFIAHIDTICPKQMPFYLTDISQSWDWPWNQNDSPDNVLQLRFLKFDPRNLRKNLSNLKTKGFALYQVYISISIDSINERQQATALNILHRSLSGFRVLILNYNSENVSIYLNHHDSNGQLNQQPLITVNQKTVFDRINVFNQTFGEYERMQSIVIDPIEADDIRTIFHADYVVNFYQLHLENSCIKSKKIFIVIEQTNKITYYKEIFYNVTELDRKTSLRLNNSRSIKYTIVPAPLTLTKGKFSQLRELQPFHLMKFRAIFIYGSNFKRERNIFTASGSVQLVAVLIVLFMAVTAIILWFLRQKFRHSRNEFQLAFIDSLVLIIGGGNLQLDHRFERWFFGTLLIGVFFMMAVFGGNLLDCFISVSDAKVRTFDDLAETNSTIYIDFELLLYVDEILDKLRNKIGKNFTYESAGIIQKVIEHTEHSECFVIITESEWINVVRAVAVWYKRDFDVLEEILGEFVGAYVLTNNYYISDRTMEKLDKLSATMVESGLFQFYMSFKKYQEKRAQMKEFWEHGLMRPEFRNLLSKVFVGYIDSDEGDIEPFTMKQLQRPVFFVLYLFGIAAIIFLAEYIVYQWRDWRDRRVQVLPIPRRIQETTRVPCRSREYRSASAAFQNWNQNQSKAKRCQKKHHSARF